MKPPSGEIETDSDQILERYAALRAEIDSLCGACGRAPSSVKLMLVTKTVPIGRIRPVIAAGHRLFGENKVQELAEKRADLADPSLDFHFIGHLQTNKVKKCLENTSLVHSVDRLPLALEMNKQLQKTDRTMKILIQVNTSGEESKFGVRPSELLPLIRVQGLMTLARFSADQEIVRPCFRILRQLAEDVRAEKIENVEMNELSMGMSSDYRIAIEEGATIVRVGTAVFGQRPLPDSHYWPENPRD
ncbi:MAG TPA: YggS family pyridoxal phosphate-dependent enzyme [Pseudobdellovibrionaceae bacterium]|nr:YggS family pyridoxal phosphate-dependent enzyme [Pseudobdellovibrionaceae bacterium]